MPTEKDILRFWSKVDRKGDNACWIWKGAKNEKGYGMFRLGLRMVRSHRIAYQIAYGEIPDSLLVCHQCDNPSCCNPSHMFLGTTQDNVDDKMRKGRIDSRIGEKNANHKLSDKQVVEIRQRFLGGGEKQADLARAFGVSRAHIWEIVNCKIRNQG